MKQLYLLLKKKFVLTLFVAFSYNTAPAQYQQLVVDSSLWIIEWQDLGTPYADDYYGYYILNDTIINTVSYKKVYKIYLRNEAPFWPQPFKLDSMVLFGFIRENAKQVFALTSSPVMSCSTTSEYLLYDFNYNIGDTIDLCLHINSPFLSTIYNIDTINGIKTFYVDNGGMFSEVKGSWNGLFDFIGFALSGFNSLLFSHCRGDLASCNVLTAINVIDEYNSPEIFPNPVTDYLTVRNLPKNGNYHLQLIDATGRIVFKTKLKSLELQTIMLPVQPGFYTVLVNDNANYLHRSKILCLTSKQ